AILRGLGTPYDALFSPDGRLFAIASEPGPARFFDSVSLEQTARIKSHFIHSIGFSPDGKRFATGGAGKEAIKIWDSTSKLDLLTLEGKGSLFNPTFFSADGNLLASCTSGGGYQLRSGGVLHIWRAPSWKEIAAEEKKTEGKTP